MNNFTLPCFPNFLYWLRSFFASHSGKFGVFVTQYKEGTENKGTIPGGVLTATNDII